MSGNHGVNGAYVIKPVILGLKLRQGQKQFLPNMVEENVREIQLKRVHVKEWLSLKGKLSN